MIRFSCWIILKVVKHSYHIKNAISKILEFFKKQFWTKSDKKILTLIFLIPFISMIFFVKIRLDLTEKKNTNEKSHFVWYLETMWLFWDEILHKIFFHQCVNFVSSNQLRAGAWNHLLNLWCWFFARLKHLALFHDQKYVNKNRKAEISLDRDLTFTKDTWRFLRDVAPLYKLTASPHRQNKIQCTNFLYTSRTYIRNNIWSTRKLLVRHARPIAKSRGIISQTRDMYRALTAH